MIGRELARTLGLRQGDKLRLDTGQQNTTVVNLAAIFEFGVRDLDARFVYLDLKQAQSLLDLPGGVTVIDLKVEDIFAAELVARRLEAADRTGGGELDGDQRSTDERAVCAKPVDQHHHAFRWTVGGFRHRQRIVGERGSAHSRDRHSPRHRGQPESRFCASS